MKVTVIAYRISPNKNASTFKNAFFHLERHRCQTNPHPTLPWKSKGCCNKLPKLLHISILYFD